MKEFFFAALFFVSLGSTNVAALESKCGRISGVYFNHPDNDTQGISGFWLKQATSDIRLTRGDNEELMIELEELKERTGLFICLDDYELEYRPYSGRRRLYGKVFAYRLWQRGQRLK